MKLPLWSMFFLVTEVNHAVLSSSGSSNWHLSWETSTHSWPCPLLSPSPISHFLPIPLNTASFFSVGYKQDLISIPDLANNPCIKQQSSQYSTSTAVCQHLPTARKTSQYPALAVGIVGSLASVVEGKTTESFTIKCCSRPIPQDH